MSNLALTIFYIVLMFLAVPKSVDAFEENKKVLGSILMLSAWTCGILAAIGLNLWLMEMGL